MAMVSPRGNCRIGGTIATKAMTSDLIRLRFSAVMICWSGASSWNTHEQSKYSKGGGLSERTFQCSRTKFLKKRAAAWRTGRETSDEAMRFSRLVRKSGRDFASVFNVDSAVRRVSQSCDNGDALFRIRGIESLLKHLSQDCLGCHGRDAPRQSRPLLPLSRGSQRLRVALTQP